jgi:hypothetical protein
MGKEKIMSRKAANVHRINLVITLLSVALFSAALTKHFYGKTILMPRLCI